MGSRAERGVEAADQLEVVFAAVEVHSGALESGSLQLKYIEVRVDGKEYQRQDHKAKRAEAPRRPSPLRSFGRGDGMLGRSRVFSTLQTLVHPCASARAPKEVLEVLREKVTALVL